MKLRILLVALILMSGCSSPEKTAEERRSEYLLEYLGDQPAAAAEPAVTDWAPSEFTEWDNKIAYRFAKGEWKLDCYSCRGWLVEVIANTDGCTDGVYASLNAEKDGVVIDDTNAVLSYLGPSQKGRLGFEFYSLDGSGFGGNLTELNCK